MGKPCDLSLDKLVEEEYEIHLVFKLIPNHFMSTNGPRKQGHKSRLGIGGPNASYLLVDSTGTVVSGLVMDNEFDKNWVKNKNEISGFRK